MAIYSQGVHKFFALPAAFYLFLGITAEWYKNIFKKENRGPKYYRKLVKFFVLFHASFIQAHQFCLFTFNVLEASWSTVKSLRL